MCNTSLCYRIFHSVTLQYSLPTIHGSLFLQALSFNISGIRILVSVFWGSILSPGSPFQPFPTFNSGGWWFTALGDDFVVYLWRSISLLLVSYIPNLSCGHLLSQSIFSLLASFVPKAQPNESVFLGWDYFLKTIFVQGPLRVYQLSPTNFATS